MSLCNDTTSTMLVQPATCGSENGGGWGGAWGESFWFIIIILALFCNGGFGGFGGGYGNGGGVVYDTGAAMQRGFDTQTIVGKLDGLNNGLCSLGYDQLAQMNGINASIAALGSQLSNAVCTLGYNTAQLANGVQMQVANEARTLDTNLCVLGNNIAQQFNAANVANLQGQYATQTAIMQGQNALQNQLSGCCCDIREGISGVNYNAAMNANALQGAVRDGFCQTNFNAQTNTRDIIEAQRGGFQSIMDKLCQMEYNGLNDKYQAAIAENQSLKSDLSNMRQNAYLVDQLGPKCPQAAYVVQPPQNVTFPTSCCGVANYGGNGCGC